MSDSDNSDRERPPTHYVFAEGMAFGGGAVGGLASYAPESAPALLAVGAVSAVLFVALNNRYLRTDK